MNQSWCFGQSPAALNAPRPRGCKECWTSVTKISVNLDLTPWMIVIVVCATLPAVDSTQSGSSTGGHCDSTWSRQACFRGPFRLPSLAPPAAADRQAHQSNRVNTVSNGTVSSWPTNVGIGAHVVAERHSKSADLPADVQSARTVIQSGHIAAFFFAARCVAAQAQWAGAQRRRRGAALSAGRGGPGGALSAVQRSSK